MTEYGVGAPHHVKDETMPPMLPPLADGGAPRYRTVDAARIVEMLLVLAWPYEVRYGDAARAAKEARAALEHCVALGLPSAASPDGPLFDPAEVVNFIIWAGMRGGDRLWHDRFVATGRRLARDLHPPSADAGAAPSALPPARYRITLRRTVDPRFCPPAARLRLRLPLPLEDGALRDLRVTPIQPAEGPELRYTAVPGRLDATLPAATSSTVTLAADVSFVAHARPATAGDRLTAEDSALYTRPAEGLAQITPRIAALAADLAGADALATVERFWDFLIDTLVCGVVRYDQVPASGALDWVLDQGWCDCQLGSALLVALCRARNIPARLCSGYLLYPLGPFFHYWAEIWLPPSAERTRGWAAFDLSVSGLSAGGRDRAWRGYFRGAIDYRAATESLPRLFTGFGALRLPDAWHLLRRQLADGVETSLHDSATGDAVFIDRISVHAPSLDDRYAATPTPPA